MRDDWINDPEQRTRVLVLGVIALAALAVIVVLVSGALSGGPKKVTADEQKTPSTTQQTPAEAPQPTEATGPTGPTDEEKKAVGSVLIGAFSGLQIPPELLERIHRGELAGIALIGENVSTADQVKQVTAEVRKAAKDGGQLAPLILTDQEGGEIVRFASVGPDDAAAQLGARGTDGVREAGKATGEGLKGFGVNVDLAPVADVLTNANSFIGERSFAPRPELVARYACAFAEGLVAGGVAATLKHFPGLGGAAATNTDDAAVRINRSRENLMSDWAAYEQCGNSEKTLTMVSNASYPKLTGTLPAVVSGETYRSLRKLDVAGPYITDSLDAKAVLGRKGLAVDALTAGADILLYTLPGSAERARRQLLRALTSGDLKPEVLKLRAERVDALRKALSE